MKGDRARQGEQKRGSFHGVSDLSSAGGPGKREFNTCHGVWINTLRAEPEVYIADRHNARVQVFDFELTFKRELKGDYRMPCCLYVVEWLPFGRPRKFKHVPQAA